MSTAAPNVDVTRAVDMLGRENVRLLDVREDDEWAAGHAPAAEHMQLSQLDPRAFTDAGTVVVTCRSGNRSSKAAATLVEAGVDAVNLDGGMKAWAQAGHPLVRDDGTPGTVA
ncbi:rhodanese-like domain-containing protein [Mycolicibacterium gilvum]|uniref:Rhodanese domain-containing protein n=1 Tax=Mycolicibacterium gilvum TaxID=1804 RepID=A0A379MP25_9MYCO|nr:rhodanese-like domain-containing protein [Mycolicibacterium gilvum]MCV7056588.1 rhodanese-like domain-containing protein [Mycolicibacterium gilvum]SUE32587.1 rhodanese domain-containing protein [Mycolicibacterium gilvum]